MEDKTVLITGASRGIGAAAARVFSQAGARVALLARTSHEIDRIAGEIGDGAIAVPCDVSDYQAVENGFARVVDAFGGLDVVISNAGVIEPISHLVSSDPKAWGRGIDINLKGAYHCMRAALPVFQANGGGTILSVSSGAAHSPMEAWSQYCAAKAGAAMLTRSVDMEARQFGVRAIGLSPGTVATDMQREIRASGINPVSKKDWADHIPPDWAARALLWMCSAAADEFLGQDIRLGDDGIRRKIGLIQ